MDSITHLLGRDVAHLSLEPLEALNGPLQVLQGGYRPLGGRHAAEGGVAVRLDAVHPEAAL